MNADKTMNNIERKHRGEVEYLQAIDHVKTANMAVFHKVVNSMPDTGIL
jgi:radical SAM superfamily enzyme